MKRTCKTLLTLAFMLFSSAAVSAQSAPWPGWLGPDRSGVVADKAYKTDWSDGLNKVWSAQIGRGFASMSVAADTLFAMGHEGGQETVFAFDAKTGKKHWDYSYPSKLVDNLHEGGPSATPTWDKGKLYTLSKQGHLHCFDAGSGKVLWKKDTWKEAGSKMPTWGFCSSPLILGDMVILEVGATIAFDKNTGKKLWQTQVYKAGYGSVISFKRQGKNYIAIFNAVGLIIINPENGQEIAKFTWKTRFDVNSATPMILDGGNKIFISSGYGKGCAMVAFNGSSLSKLWQNTNMKNHMNNSVYVDGYIYGFDGNTPRANFNCINAKTGDKVWSKSGLGAGSLIAAGGKLLILSERGQLVLAKPTPKEYAPLHQEQIIGGRCWTHPIVAQGFIYARNAKGLLVCMDARP